MKDSLFPAEEWLAVLQHHDAITGTHAAYVGLDYLAKMDQKLKPSRHAYADAIHGRLAGELGVRVKGGSEQLRMCGDKKITDVVVGCKPLALELGAGGEFFTVVHNPSSAAHQDQVRIELPADTFAAEVYDVDSKAFVAARSELFEQEHFSKDGNMTASLTPCSLTTRSGRTALHCSS